MPGRFRPLQEIPYTHGQGRGISESRGSKLHARFEYENNRHNAVDTTKCIFTLQNVGIDKGDIPDLTKVGALKVLFIISLFYYNLSIRACLIIVYYLGE